MPQRSRTANAFGGGDTWLLCYHAALTGIIAAQIRTPNPDVVARLAVTFANVANKAAESHLQMTNAARKRKRRTR
jgi:hypothetical protein